ncbi:hypothetical protein [Streptomyces sp. NPDC020983]|uniref:hypothetical protein n=1 Tax=Streptomyces sp. NPDC020983 TaxID=3365106 RepID=UPI0037BBD8F7
MTALLASPWGAPACGCACLAAVATGVYLGAVWDRATARTAVARAWLNPNGAHRR